MDFGVFGALSGSGAVNIFDKSSIMNLQLMDSPAMQAGLTETLAREWYGDDYVPLDVRKAIAEESDDIQKQGMSPTMKWALIGGTGLVAVGVFWLVVR